MSIYLIKIIVYKLRNNTDALSLLFGCTGQASAPIN